MLYLLMALTAAFALVLRLAPIWQHRHRGCDAYYFLLCVDEFRKHRKIPIVLPDIYMLEQREQWYPPGFAVFLSLFPRRLLDKYYWLITPFIDAMVAVILCVIVYFVTFNAWLAALAGTLYGLNASSIIDCTSLNSRGLGALIFSMFMLCVIMLMVSHQYYLLAFISLFGFCLLMTHKLSSQMLYFLLPFMAVVTSSPLPFYLLGGVLVLSYIASGGFVVKIWKGQSDILKFWRANWRDLGVHEIYDSPIYKMTSSHRWGKVFYSGLRGNLRLIAYMGLNPFALMLIFPIIKYHVLSQFDLLMLWWVAGVYVLAAITLFVPQLRFLGEGYRYLKLAALPVCYLAILPIYYHWGFGNYYALVLLVSLVIAIAIYCRLFWFMSRPKETTIPFLDRGLQDTIAYLKRNDVKLVLCVPDSIGDAIGYYARCKVLRGTHNYPFAMVKPFFPMRKLPLDYLVKGYGISHVVISLDYVCPDILELNADSKVQSSGKYEIYDVGNEVVV